MATSGERPLSQSVIDEWHVEQGLPQESVEALAVDGHGYLWIGTESGLVRFDGLRFHRFALDATGSRRSEYVNALLATTHDGGLWVATLDVPLGRVEDGRYTPYVTDDGHHIEAAFALGESHDGALWVGTVDGVVIRLRDRHATRLESAGGLVHAIVEDRRGTMWVASDRGLYRVDGDRLVRDPMVPQVRTVALLADRQGALWVATSRGLYRRSGDNVTVLGETSGLPSSDIRALAEDASGRIWIATQHGLARWVDGRLSLAPTSRSVGSTQVAALQADSEGDMWAGGAGLSRIKDGLLVTWSKDEGLPFERSCNVLADDDGSLWVTGVGGVAKLRDGRVVDFPGRELVSGLSVSTILRDRQGSLWVGTWNDGLYELRDGRLRNRYTRKNGLADNTVRNLFEDREGRIWVGTEHGIQRFENGRLGPPDTVATGLAHERTYVITQDRSGVIWTGSFHGVSRFRDGHFTRYPNGPLARAAVTAIHEGRDGTLWFGSFNSGLIRLRGDSTTVYTEREGLAEDSVGSILEDDGGNLWLGGTVGIYRLTRAELEAVGSHRAARLHPVVYGRSDGMKSPETAFGSPPNACAARDGKLWFATQQRGVVRVDPADAELEPRPPTPVIEGLEADGVAQPVTAADRLHPGTRSFRVHYSAIALRDAERVVFRYRLEGFDAGWLEAGARREVSYTNLAPGRYRFRVSARGPRGDWSAAEATLVVGLLPRFHQTWWFRLLCLLGALLLLLTAYSLRIRQLRRRERDLVHQVTERQEFLHVLSHELKTPLTILNLRVQRTIEAAEKWPEAEERARLASVQEQVQRVAAIVDRAVDLSQIERGERTLAPEELDLGQLTRTVVERNGAAAAKAGSTITVEAPGPVRGEWDRRGLEQAIEILLSNALKFGAGRPVTVAVVARADRALVTVRDQGMGIAASDQARIFERFTRAVSGRHYGGLGLGLWVCRQLVEAMGGTVTVESTLGSGATFTLDLPIET